LGSKRSFQCEKCGYSAEVSGKEDAGMRIRTKTVLCTKCKELVDIVTGFTTKSDVQLDIIGKCPLCDSDNHIVPWDNNTKPCPKCGSKLIDFGTVVMWD